MSRMLCLALMASMIADSAVAVTPKRRPAVLTSRRPATRPDPARLLVGEIALNSVRPGEDLFAACAKSDFKLLALALQAVEKAISIEKSEYETEAEFAARRTKLEDILNPTSEIIICQPLDDNEDAPFTYDADQETFTGSFDEHQNVWRDVKKTGSYVSRTRMGIRATVTSSVEVEYNVTFDSALSKRRPSCLKGSYKLEYQMPVPRAQAPTLKARGYLVFTGSLAHPFVEISDSPGEPTLDDPHDVYERNITVHFRPGAAAIVGPGGMSPWKCVLLADQQNAVAGAKGPSALGRVRPGATPDASAMPIDTAKNVVEPARARANLASYITDGDYPPSAVKAGAGGTVGFQLDVGIDGRVVGCSITSSSGFPELDSATCGIMRSRARFTPARDGVGNPTPDSVSSRVRWVPPTE